MQGVALMAMLLKVYLNWCGLVLSNYTFKKYVECKHVFHFCISQAVLHYYLSDVPVLSKYLYTVRKFSELLVRGVVYSNKLYARKATKMICCNKRPRLACV